MTTSTPAEHAPVGLRPARPLAIRRTAETWVAAAGAALTTALLGGFSLVVNRLDERAFLDTVYPAMRDAGMVGLPDGASPTLAPEAAFDGARTLAAWFGLTVMVVLALTVVGIALARRRPGRRGAGWWFLAAGLACLFGSQMVLYPVAFLFFVSAGMFALRRPDHRSTR